MAKKPDIVRRRSGRPSSGKKAIGIVAVDQALQLLNVIATRLQPQSLMQLSHHSGMKASKLHRYLVSLCRSGLIVKSELGLYELGVGAVELGANALAKLDELASLDALLTELVNDLNEGAFLYVWTSAGPVMVRSRRPAYWPITLRIGTIAPLVGSASGPVFAAYLPLDETKQILMRDAVAAGVDPADASRILFDVIVPRIRVARVYLSETTLIPNSRACAAPVFDAQGDLLYVIGVSLRRIGAAKSPEKVVETVCSLGREMSRRIGYRSAKT